MLPINRDISCLTQGSETSGFCLKRSHGFRVLWRNSSSPSTATEFEVFLFQEHANSRLTSRLFQRYCIEDPTNKKGLQSNQAKRSRR